MQPSELATVLFAAQDTIAPPLAQTFGLGILMRQTSAAADMVLWNNLTIYSLRLWLVLFIWPISPPHPAESTPVDQSKFDLA